MKLGRDIGIVRAFLSRFSSCTGATNSSVVGHGRVAADTEVVLHAAFGRQAVVVPADRVEHRLSCHALVPGDDVGLGVGEDVADVERARHRRRRGVDRVHVAPSPGRIEPVGPVLFPARSPSILEAFQRRSFGHARSGHWPSTVLLCCAFMTRPWARPGSCRLVEPGQVGLYICGSTVYGPPHIGHGRFSLVYDVLRRFLEYSGFSVDHVSNVTDIDDKIIARANEEHRLPEEIAEQYETEWWDAMSSLGVPPADPYPARDGLYRGDGGARGRTCGPRVRLRDR